MKVQFEDIIKIKIAISLRTLLKQNKEYSRKIEKSEEVTDSYDKIAINADIRKATVTLAFNGVTRTAMTTIILIVEAMGYTLQDFSKIYSDITDKQISDFRRENNIYQLLEFKKLVKPIILLSLALYINSTKKLYNWY